MAPEVEVRQAVGLYSIPLASELSALRRTALRHNAPMAPGVAGYILGVGQDLQWPYPARILDPMAGVASGLRVAQRMGHAVVGIEIEERYAHVAQALLDKTAAERTPWSIPGQGEIIHGDARAVLRAWRGELFDVAITSPPYFATLRPNQEGPFAPSYGVEIPFPVGTPEYQEYVERRRLSVLDERRKPYYGAYGESAGQLSLLSEEEFWLALREIYELVFTVTTPTGWLVTVTKDYVANKQRVAINDDNRAIAEAAGWRCHLIVKALGAHGGIWKRIYNKKMRQQGRDDLVIDEEEIQFFSKGVYTNGQ